MADRTQSKRAEPDDPMALTGVAMPTGPDDDEAMAAMTESLADEFLRMGHSPEQVMQMFRDPFYRMTHAIWRVWGEESVRGAVHKLARRYEGLAPRARSVQKTEAEGKGDA
jgi:hypothetical protein